MLKSWNDYAGMASQLFSQKGFIPIMAEFGPELQEITIALLWRAIGEEKKIKFLIDSSGGSAAACIAMRNVLLLAQLESPTLEVIGIVLSRAHSSAFFLLQACTKRIAIEGATLLLHWGNNMFGNNERAALMRGETWPIEHLREYNESMVKVVAKRTGVSEEKLRDFADRERFFTASEARKENFVDVVIPSLRSEIPAEVLEMLAGVSTSG